jgi:hypothetical protein
MTSTTQQASAFPHTVRNRPHELLPAARRWYSRAFDNPDALWRLIRHRESDHAQEMTFTGTCRLAHFDGCGRDPSVDLGVSQIDRP